MAGAAQKRGIETSLSGVQGKLISCRLLGSNNHGNSLGRLVARSATSILLAGIAAALVYESTQRKQTPQLAENSEPLVKIVRLAAT